VLGACGARPPAKPAAEAGQPQEVGYLVPPEPDTVRRDGSGVVLAGRGPALGKVRLAQPNGQAVFAAVDAQGRWSLPLGPAQGPRIFGLSAISGSQTAQAAGYVLVTPAGQAAVLRAGAAAVRIDSVAAPGFRAIDFDAGGGLQVACAAPPRATVILSLDGRQIAEGRADEAGRFVASFPPPGRPGLRPGGHQLEMVGDGFADAASFTLGAVAPLAEGPMRSQLTPAGLRLDWMTPGGGVQSTLLTH
jgi:hypothetical protein